MELKFTFEDGSEAYLQHYGVKGMKWQKRKTVEEVKMREKRRSHDLARYRMKTMNGLKMSKIKSRVKAHFSDKPTGKKDLSGRTVVYESLGKGKFKKSYL